jgi:glutaminase
MSTADQIQAIVEDTYQKYKDVNDGEVATYIPELAKADPDGFGICIVTVDGRAFSAGDCEQEFTIQSICKPFAFQLALEELGREATLRCVGVEPTGDAFNSIELEPKTMRPFNPMVNAGAIAVASLIKKGSSESGVRAFVEKMQAAAGRTLRIDESVLASESVTGHRNQSLAIVIGPSPT